MSLRQTRSLGLILVLVFFTLPFGISAQQNVLPSKIVPCDGTNYGGGKECTVCDIATLAQNVINTGIYIAVFLSAILFAWAGWKYLTHGANPGEATKATKIFSAVATGLIIILGAWLLIDTLMKVLVGGNSQFGPWNKLCELLLTSTGLA